MNLKEALKEKLTGKELALVPSSFDVVGDILIFSDFPKELCKKEKIVAETLLKLQKSVKVIAKKVHKYSGRYRTPKLKIIAGEKRKETAYRENNTLLKLNVETCYFSPRLSNERKRIASLVKKDEDILIMFSGVAVYPLVISKNTKAKSITAIEINPKAHKYAVENLKLNKIKNIRLFKGDVRKVMHGLKKRFDRIAMPLPKGGEGYLNLALKAIKKKGMMHFYDFLHEAKFSEAAEKIGKACKTSKKRYKIINFAKCGQFGPGIFRICVDFQVL